MLFAVFGGERNCEKGEFSLVAASKRPSERRVPLHAASIIRFNQLMPA